MSKTLLELTQDVTTELAAVAVPNAVATSAALQNLQFMALANALGRELMQRQWQRLDKEYTFLTVATSMTGTTTSGSPIVTVSSTSGLTTDYGVSGTGISSWSQIQSVDSSTQITMNQNATASGSVTLTFSQNQYSLPSDFVAVINDTEWDRTNRWPMMGPQTPQDWQFIKGGVVSQGPRTRFRIQGNKLLLNPSPANGVRFAFEYKSNGWVTSSSGLVKTKFSADDDTCMFDDHLMVLGIKLKWLQAKGLEWAYVKDEYLRQLDTIVAQDAGARTLSLSKQPPSIYIGPWSIPDGNWGQS